LLYLSSSNSLKLMRESHTQTYTSELILFRQRSQAQDQFTQTPYTSSLCLYLKSFIIIIWVRRNNWYKTKNNLICLFGISGTDQRHYLLWTGQLSGDIKWKVVRWTCLTKGNSKRWREGKKKEGK
jgi:predicted alpha/beta-fold hydrolase